MSRWLPAHEVADYGTEDSPGSIPIPRSNPFDMLRIVLALSDAISGGTTSGTLRDDALFRFLTSVRLVQNGDDNVIEVADLIDLAHYIHLMSGIAARNNTAGMTGAIGTDTGDFVLDIPMNALGSQYEDESVYDPTGLDTLSLEWDWGGRNDLWTGSDRTHSFTNTQVRAYIRPRTDLAGPPLYRVSYKRKQSDDFTTPQTGTRVELHKGKNVAIRHLLIRAFENGARGDALIDNNPQVVSGLQGGGEQVLSKYRTWNDGVRSLANELGITSLPAGILLFNFDPDGDFRKLVNTDPGAFQDPAFQFDVSTAPVGASTVFALQQSVHMTQAGLQALQETAPA